MTQYPRCNQCTCHSWAKFRGRGICLLLTDNNFDKKECPFYVPEEVAKKAFNVIKLTLNTYER